jgi:hypothetical protein
LIESGFVGSRSVIKVEVSEYTSRVSGNPAESLSEIVSRRLPKNVHIFSFMVSIFN